MSTPDKISLTIMTIVTLFVFYIISYDLGQANMCEKDADYVWNRDFGKCVKIGKGAYK